MGPPKPKPVQPSTSIHPIPPQLAYLPFQTASLAFLKLLLNLCGCCFFCWTCQTATVHRRRRRSVVVKWAKEVSGWWVKLSATMQADNQQIHGKVNGRDALPGRPLFCSVIGPKWRKKTTLCIYEARALFFPSLSLPPPNAPQISPASSVPSHNFFFWTGYFSRPNGNSLEI